MAFALDNLNPIGGVAAAKADARPALFTYYTEDLQAAVDNAQYFNDAVKHLKKGDVILATTDSGAKFAIYVVASNDGTDVDTYNAISAATFTDAD